MAQDGSDIPPPQVDPQMVQSAHAEGVETACCSQAKGFIFAVSNKSWFTIPEFLRAFHRAVPMRHLLIYVPTAMGPFGLPAAEYRRLAEERRQSLGYKVVT